MNLRALVCTDCPFDTLYSMKEPHFQVLTALIIAVLRYPQQFRFVFSPILFVLPLGIRTAITGFRHN